MLMNGPQFLLGGPQCTYHLSARMLVSIFRTGAMLSVALCKVHLVQSCSIISLAVTFPGNVELPGGREPGISGPVRNITPCRDTVPIFCYFQWDMKFTSVQTTWDWQVCLTD